jgi:hypothetical protein
LILAWPLLVAIAAALMWRHRHDVGGRGPRWTLVWIAGGFLMSFSLITGFTIGLFVLPLAAAVLIWVSRRAPHFPEAAGFVGGIAVTVLVVVAINA